MRSSSYITHFKDILTYFISKSAWCMLPYVYQMPQISQNELFPLMKWEPNNSPHVADSNFRRNKHVPRAFTDYICCHWEIQNRIQFSLYNSQCLHYSKVNDRLDILHVLNVHNSIFLGHFFRCGVKRSTIIVITCSKITRVILIHESGKVHSHWITVYIEWYV